MLDQAGNAIKLFIDSMRYISDVELLEELEDIFPEQTNTVIEEMGKDTLIGQIEEIIEGDIDSYVEFDEGLKEEMESKIHNMSITWGIDKDMFDSMLYNKLQECGVTEDPEPMEDYGGSSSSDEHIDIVNMFNSLRE